MPGDVQSMFL